MTDSFRALRLAMTTHLHWLDHGIILLYMAVAVGLGFALRHQSSRDEFFSAGRSMGRLTVGLSVMATLFSCNSFVMYPSAAYADSLRVMMALVAFWAMGPLVIHVFIPVYARLNCNTAYEYLEKRFHVSVRTLASGLFILLRIAWMAAATFAASVAIAGISGVDQITIIFSLGIVSILYTMMGGLRAVMWTDVLQFFVFAGTILFAMGLLVSQADGGLSGILQTYFDTPRTPGGAKPTNLLFDFSMDLTLKYGTIALFVGSFLEGLSAFGVDQIAVQRYIASRDVKTSQSGFMINLLGLTVVVPGLLLIGTGLFSYFHQHPEDLAPALAQRVMAGKVELPEGLPIPQESDQGNAEMWGTEAYFRQNPEQIRPVLLANKLEDQALPQFVRLKFPPGVVGLLVAALMAATMSSIDSGIHSVTTAIVVDFRDRLFPAWRPATDAGEMWTARILLVLIGAVAVVLACYVGQLGNVFDVAKKSTSAFGGPLLSVFVVGLFSRRATTIGVFLGTLLGAGVTLWALYQYPWDSMWFWPLGFGTAIVLSLAISVMTGSAGDGPAPLTFGTVMRSGSDD